MFPNKEEWGEWPSGLRRCERFGRFLVQTPLDTRPGLWTTPIYECPGDLLVESDKNAVSEAVPSITGQSWRQDDQVAYKKRKHCIALK